MLHMQLQTFGIAGLLIKPGGEKKFSFLYRSTFCPSFSHSKTKTKLAINTPWPPVHDANLIEFYYIKNPNQCPPNFYMPDIITQNVRYSTKKKHLRRLTSLPYFMIQLIYKKSTINFQLHVFLTVIISPFDIFLRL